MYDRLQPASSMTSSTGHSGHYTPVSQRTDNKAAMAARYAAGPGYIPELRYTGGSSRASGDVRHHTDMGPVEEGYEENDRELPPMYATVFDSRGGVAPASQRQ